MAILAAEVRSFAVTIPAGTPKSAPLVTPVSFPARTLTGIRWQVPPGPSGTMGWRLTQNNGVPVIPYGGGWIITDNAQAEWEVIGQPDNGAWEVTGYNTDTNPHTVYLDFLLDVPGRVQAPVTLLPNAVLSSPASSSASAIPVG